MAYRFEYRVSFWQDYSAALSYIAESPTHHRRTWMRITTPCA